MVSKISNHKLLRLVSQARFKLRLLTYLLDIQKIVLDITSSVLVNKNVVSRHVVSLEKKSFSQESSGSKLEL